MKGLLKDLEKAVEFDQSTLFKKVYEEEYGTLGGEPYSMLVGDYEFSRTLDDINMLKLVSGVAASAHAPFIANASSKLFNMDSFVELTAPRDLSKIFEGVEYMAWKSFRDSEDSRYVALTLPRVLGRLPYGEEFKRVHEFNFEEFVDGRDHDKYLWMGAAWAYSANIADCYSKYGWMARTRGVEGGGKVEDLPVHTFATDDGDVAAKCPTEIAISDRREFELSNLGFLPLVHSKNNDFAVFMGAQSCQKPKTLASRRTPTCQRTAVVQVQLHPLRIAFRPLSQGDGARQDRQLHGTRRVREVAQPLDQQLRHLQPGGRGPHAEGQDAAVGRQGRGPGGQGQAGLV